MQPVDATAVQTLLGWLTDPHLTDGQGSDNARTAAAALADAARTVLGTGPTGEQITAAWPDLLTTCPGCPTCQPDTTTGRTAGLTADGQVRVVAPLYQRIAAELADQIHTGQLAPGARLPSETDLSTQYQVSRITARAAVAVLRTAGLVTTRHGLGSHVTHPTHSTQRAAAGRAS